MKAEQKLIPVFQVLKMEVSKDDADETILYAQSLELVDEDLPQVVDSEHARGALLKIKDTGETFITTDLVNKHD